MVSGCFRWYSSCLVVLIVCTVVSSNTLYFRPQSDEESGVSDHVALDTTHHCPDPTYSCSDNKTCCINTAGTYGCCPFKSGVCCSDRIHCCPKGSVCDTKKQICETSTSNEIVPWQLVDHINDQRKIVCPGGKSECHAGQTCCAMGGGFYGCCPYPRATCCRDGKHCCKVGYRCDLRLERCIKNWDTDGTAELFLEAIQPSVELHESSDYATDSSDAELPLQKISRKLGAIPNTIDCPGSEVKCPDHTTCCNATGGGVGCCPVPNAVCCSDGIHCCPAGTTCDIHLQRCSKTVLAPQVVPTASQQTVRDVKCPDGSTCEGDHTCCPLPDGKTYACCAESEGVCCSDHIHCCSKDQTCDAQGHRCISKRTGQSSPLLNKTPAKRGTTSSPAGLVSATQGNVVCPDKSYQCPDGMTCCLMTTGEYGCCPLPKAVCCADKLHCCPNKYKCLEGGICKPADGGPSVPAALKQQAQPVENSIVCPDKSKCGDDQTCCAVGGGRYACCPAPQAVCCADHLHCCPQGYICDPTSGDCTQDPDTISYIRRLFSPTTTPPHVLAVDDNAAHPVAKVGTITCPDKVSVCPDGMTCCLTASHQYACCPLPQATCCSDGLHCCPHGSTCDLVRQQCISKTTSTDLVAKVPASTLPDGRDDGSNQICPDKTRCIRDWTCCRLKSGKFGCCPLPKAVCCSDGEHCCPQNYTCSVDQCLKDSVVLELVDLEASLYVAEDESMDNDSNGALASEDRVVNDIKCDDNKTTCPEGMTCCDMKHQQKGCCPHPNATCCGDGVHCCKSGDQCTKEGKCTSSVPWYSKIMALSVSEVADSDVGDTHPCPDPHYSCDRLATCCPTRDHTWGCCPLPMATCCRDQVHCCRRGFKCTDRGCYRAELEGIAAEFVSAIILTEARYDAP